MSRPRRLVKNAACLMLFSCLSVSAVAFTKPSAVPTEVEVNLPNFTELFEKASPAVVNISTLAIPKNQGARIYGPGGEELPEIFRRYFGIPYPDTPPPTTPQPLSLGSGFIISDDGYILTNNHVVEGADEIIVKLSDRSEFKAELVGADKRSDLALLKIKAKNKLPVVKLGDSDKIKPGQWVAAIGSPFNFQYSITKGIVSALNRSLPGDAYVPFIQTDVPINPGNSGGPLFNMLGEVIGINSQIFTRSGGFMGLSFAIPIDHVMWAVEQIKEKGYVARAWLGVGIQEVDHNLAESFGLEKPMGALVSQVVPGGPADKAQLHPGDIIVRLNDKPIHSADVLPMIVGTVPIGDKAKVEYIRDGKEAKATVTVGELPNETSMKSGQSIKQHASENRLGIQVAELNKDYRATLRLGNDVKGVVVVEIFSGAARAIGLRKGDVITHLNTERIRTPKEFDAVVKGLPDNRSISMRVIRDTQPAFITFKLST